MSIFSPPEGNDPKSIKGEGGEINGIVSAKSAAKKIANKVK